MEVCSVASNQVMAHAEEVASFINLPLMCEFYNDILLIPEA
jgi:hypothetical protein